MQVSHTIACPDSAIATGECHHSLVGPFVGFHHQSLLIAALWPRGRGRYGGGSGGQVYWITKTLFSTKRPAELLLMKGTHCPDSTTLSTTTITTTTTTTTTTTLLLSTNSLLPCGWYLVVPSSFPCERQCGIWCQDWFKSYGSISRSGDHCGGRGILWVGVPHQIPFQPVGFTLYHHRR